MCALDQRSAACVQVRQASTVIVSDVHPSARPGATGHGVSDKLLDGPLHHLDKLTKVVRRLILGHLPPNALSAVRRFLQVALSMAPKIIHCVTI